MTKKKEKNSVFFNGAFVFGIIGFPCVVFGAFFLWIVPFITNIFRVLDGKSLYIVSERSAEFLQQLINGGFVWLIAAICILIFDAYRKKRMKGCEENGN